MEPARDVAAFHDASKDLPARRVGSGRRNERRRFHFAVPKGGPCATFNCSVFAFDGCRPEHGEHLRG